MKMAKTIYLVTGSCGEYDDKQEWNVKAFVSKDKAEERVQKAGERATEILVSRKNFWDEIENEWDPKMQIVGGEPPDYEIEEIELEE
jgi:hypothetical protein